MNFSTKLLHTAFPRLIASEADLQAKQHFLTALRDPSAVESQASKQSISQKCYGSYMREVRRVTIMGRKSLPFLHHFSSMVWLRREL